MKGIPESFDISSFLLLFARQEESSCFDANGEKIFFHSEGSVPFPGGRLLSPEAIDMVLYHCSYHLIGAHQPANLLEIQKSVKN